MAVIFPKWTNDIPRIGTPLVLGMAALATFVVWYWFSPKHTDVGYMPTQPVPYSHKLHAGELGMDCRYCHFGAERSAHGSVPPTSVCMNCHTQVKTDSSKLLPIYASWGGKEPKSDVDGGPIAWKRIHKVSDYAYFNHSAHIGIKHKGVAVGCVTCHGRVDQMPVVHQTQPLSMSWCLDCHNNPAPNLRPIAEVTNMDWDFDKDPTWAATAASIAKELNPPGNKNAVTVDKDGHETVRATAGCTGCHR
jgi:hypothetical protein